MANYRNYSIKTSKGVFYESSKDEQTGFNLKITTRSNEIRWHRESQEIGGVMKKISIQEVNFDRGPVKLLKIMFEEVSGDIGTLSLQIFTDKSQIDSWIKAFMLYLPSLRKGEEVKFQLNRQKKDDKGYLYKNVWAKDGDNTNIPWAFDPKEAVPKAIRVPHPVTKEPMWDFTPVDSWYYEYLMSVVNAWAGDSGSDPAPAEQQGYSGGTAETSTDNSYDDLPF